MTTPSSIAQQAAALIIDRDAAGQAKYGTSMDRGDLKPGQWLRHAIEEHADALQYQIRLAQDLRAIVSMAYRRGRYEALDAAIANDDCGAVAVLEHREDEQAEEELIRELLG